MSFKNIHLPSFVLAEMYKTDIVSMEANVSPNPSSISFLGDNKKNISIFLNDEDAVFINDERLYFLSNILQACRLTVADVAIVNIKNQSFINQQNIVQQLNPKFILLFDVSLDGIGFAGIAPLYQLQKINNCTVVHAASLNTMLPNTQDAKIEKSKLWIALKTMFNI